MKWTIFAIGKPRLDFARGGIEEYAKRLRPMASVEIEFVKPSSGETESEVLLRRSEGMHRVVLDEQGEQCTSRDLATHVTRWENERIKHIALIIGGADGHSDEMRKRANWLWSLSRLTFQHELALVMVIEQIYRAYSIKAGLPYHRD
jgi:23S rRNA (pseudouridine1915-N3)-methyltransferase